MSIQKLYVKYPKRLGSLKKVSQVGTGESFNGPLYIETKNWTFSERKNAKITKQAHAIKGYLGFYNVEILISLNPEFQRYEICN